MLEGTGSGTAAGALFSGYCWIVDLDLALALNPVIHRQVDHLYFDRMNGFELTETNEGFRPRLPKLRICCGSG